MITDLDEALEIVIGRTKHEFYRALCAEDHPYVTVWRHRIVEMANESPPTPPPEVVIPLDTAAIFAELHVAAAAMPTDATPRRGGCCH